MLSVALAAAVASLAGCSGSERIGRGQAASEIRSASSFAAESEMFIDFVLQGRATHQYAEGHSAYLQQQVEQSMKDLEQAAPETGAEDSVRECRSQLKSLADEISGIRAANWNHDTLALGRTKIEEIRARLQKANSRL